MVIGALLVFTNRISVSHTGVIAARVYDPWLASRLWGKDECRWVVGLRDVREVVGVSSADLRDAAGFGRVMMAHPVSPSRRRRVLKLLPEDGWNATAAAATSARATGALTFDTNTPLSVRTEAERRVEQGWLRRQLILGNQGTCDLCGVELPAAFLRAAHIKPRHLCSEAERRDGANALVACVECDVAFERGWLALDDAQCVLTSGSLPATADLRNHLKRAAGRDVARPLTASSVRFHREVRFRP